MADDTFRVVEMIRECRFPDEAAVRAWLSTPCADMGGRRPIDAIAAGEYGRVILALRVKILREHRRIARQRDRDVAAAWIEAAKAHLARPTYTTLEAPDGDREGQAPGPDPLRELPPPAGVAAHDAAARRDR